MPKFVSTWTLPAGCKRRRKPSQFPLPSIRSYRHSRQLNLDSKTDHRSSPTKWIRRSDWQGLEEKVGANYKNRYVWSPSYIDALVTRDRDTDANGTLDERLFAQHDANFNVTAITNTSGAVQERYTPDPFGVVTFRDASGNTISASAKDWVFLHQGGQADILGHYDFRNRILSPTLGRWLTNDPLGFDAGDNNFYRYVANGPGNGLDPSGLQGGTPVTPVKPAPVIWPITGPVTGPITGPGREPKRGGPIFDPSPFNPLLPLPVAGPIPRRIPVFPGETSGIRPLPGNTPEF